MHEHSRFGSKHVHCANCGKEVFAGQSFCKACGSAADDRYRVSSAALDDASQPVSDDPPYAGFWPRAGGLVIDYIIVVVTFSLLSGLLAAAKAPAGVSFLVAVFGSWFYYAGLESSEWQATLGKRAVGIKVTDLGGERIGFPRATGRYFAHILSALIFNVGFAMAIFTERRQTLHDMIAGTLVVYRERQPRDIANSGPAPRVSPVVGTVGVVAFVLFGPFGIGMLAAIALPAYQGYMVRAQVIEGLNEAARYKAAVADAVAQGQSFSTINSRTLEVPSAQVDVPSRPLRYVESVQVQRGVVIIKYGLAASRNIAGGTLLLIPGVTAQNEVVWVCGHAPEPEQVSMAAKGLSRYSTIPDQYLPSACRVHT